MPRRVGYAQIARVPGRVYRPADSGYAARRGMPENWSDADDEALHELRKKIIRHRYQIDIVVAPLCWMVALETTSTGAGTSRTSVGVRVAVTTTPESW